MPQSSILNHVVQVYNEVESLKTGLEFSDPQIIMSQRITMVIVNTLLLLISIYLVVVLILGSYFIALSATLTEIFLLIAKYYLRRKPLVGASIAVGFLWAIVYVTYLFVGEGEYVFYFHFFMLMVFSIITLPLGVSAFFIVLTIVLVIAKNQTLVPFPTFPVLFGYSTFLVVFVFILETLMIAFPIAYSIKMLKTEITEKQVTLEEVAIQKNQYQTIFQTSPIAILEADLTDLMRRLSEFKNEDHLNEYLQGNPDHTTELMNHVNYLTVNPAVLDLYSEVDMNNPDLPFNAAISGMATTEELKSLLIQVYRHQNIVEFNFKQQAVNGDGYRDINVKLVVVDYNATSILGIVNMVDVTLIKQQEIELQRARRLEALGKLSGSIAHDFNNFLTLMIGTLEIMQDKEHVGLNIEEDINNLLSTSELAANLTKQLLSFSRRQILQYETFDLNNQIQEIQDILGLMTKSFKLTLQLDAKLSLINADISQIQQVIINLVSNSVKAMDKYGEITVRTQNIEFRSFDDSLGDLSPGTYIKIDVVDTGRGIPVEDLPLIFEPFFTTDKSGNHSGLGLATVYGIIKQLKGHLEVHSEVGIGTEFSMYLPISYAKISEDAGITEPLGKLREHQSYTLLVVDDNPKIIDLLSKTLKNHHFDIQTAKDGKTALEKFEKGKFSLIISDLMMPEMDAIDFIRKVREIDPTQKALLISDYIDIDTIDQLLGDYTSLLGKPFKIEDLITKVLELLAS